MTVTAPTSTRTVDNVIAGEERGAAGGEVFEKLAPATGEVLSSAARSRKEDIDAAISAAQAAQPDWAARNVTDRGAVLRRVAQLLERDRDEIAAIVSAETGKSPRDARGETDGAIELGYFIAGEGRRFYGKTMPSAVSGVSSEALSTAPLPKRSAGKTFQATFAIGVFAAMIRPATPSGWRTVIAWRFGTALVVVRP